MIIVDSCGWIEYLKGSKKGEKYEKYLTDMKKIITPTIVIYEVYKKIKKEKGEEKALLITSQLLRTKIIPLDADISFLAADLSLKYKLPIPDAIVYATGVFHKAKIITSDEHFKNLPEVIFI